MTIENEPRSLVADIDHLLSQATSQSTRQKLERVRAYLVSTDPSSDPIDPIVQKMIAQINDRLTEWLDALQIEIDVLGQQRQALLTDIEQLQQQRQQIMDEFLTVLSTRCLEILQQQVLSSENLKRLQFQQQSDRLLINLDATFRTVFSTLEKDLQRYYDSLSQGLERMHCLGQQGEAKLLAYVNRLSQQLEQTSKIPTADLDRNQTNLTATDHTINLKWHLGIDIHPSGIAAVLLKQDSTSLQEYPLLWEVGGQTVFRFASERHNNTPFAWLSLFKQPHPDYHLKASEISLQQALEDIDSVIIHLEAEINRLSLIQAILEANLVNKVEQIVFIESAIATLLAHLSPSASPQSTTTLVIYGGQFSTQLALVEVPSHPPSLTYNNIALSHLDYGNLMLDQDILCQLIYPQWVWAFKNAFPQLDIPQSGTSDPQTRQILTTELDSHPLGRSLLDSATLAKSILQHQPQLTSQLANRPWTVQRQDLEEKVIFPYLQSLESAILSFLSQHHKSLEDIGQVIGNGEMIAFLWKAIASWLTQMMPEETRILVCEKESVSQILRGIAHFPLYPNLFNSREKNTQ